MRPVQIDVIAPLPEGWGLCSSCEMLMARANLDVSPPQRGLDDYPEEWLADFRRLSALVFHLADRHGESVSIRVFDPHSLQGLARSLRYGVRRYPTFVVDGRAKISGCDEAALEDAIAAASLRMAGAAAAEPNPKGAELSDGSEPGVTGSLVAHLLPLAKCGVRALGQMIYGATVYEMVRDLHKERGQIERLFVLVTFGQMLGVPILPPYYTLRLLPYVVPLVEGWRHSMLRERDLTDLCDQEIT